MNGDMFAEIIARDLVRDAAPGDVLDVLDEIIDELLEESK